MSPSNERECGWLDLEGPAEGWSTPEQWLDGIVHDMRQPLSIVKLSQATLSVDIDRPELQEELHTLAAAVDYLSELVEELSDLRSVGTRDLVPTPARYDVGALVAEIVRIFQPRARLLGVRLGAVLPNRGVFATSDRRMLGRVLSNLVDNALRHGRPKGAVTLWLDSDEDYLWIRVEDDGRGLPEGFGIDPQGARRARGGHGVGLVYCVKACKALGGGLRTRAGRPGTRMLVEIPKALAPEEA